MSTDRNEHPHAEKTEKQIDKTLEDTFPASDPPSTGGSTKIDPGHHASDKAGSGARTASGTVQGARDTKEKRRHPPSENALSSSQDKNPVPPHSVRK